LNDGDATTPDRPIKGIAANEFTVDSETAFSPIGTLLKATDGSDGAKITVENGNAILFDTALYEATLPIIDLFTDPGATRNTSITTSGSTRGFIDIRNSELVLRGPVIALDKSLITVNDGPLLNLRNGSKMTVGSPLLRLLNKSQINVFNGPAIKVDGAGTSLTVNGALAVFGGSGDNTIIIKNDIIPNASRGGPADNQFPVRITGVGAGSSIFIGPNPIINTGLGSITVTEKTAGSDGGVLIQASNGGTVNITAPAP